MPRFHYHRNESCRICGSSELVAYLDLGEQPPSNAFLSAEEIPTEQSFPLTVYLCRQCGLSQLLDVVHGEDVFDFYAYLSSSSRALREHYGRMVDSLVEQYSPVDGAVVIDVGANDGITLDRYPSGRFKLIGVEPSSAGQVAKSKGHVIVKRFFGKNAGREIREAHGAAALMTATNVSAHVDNIRDFFSGFAEALAPDGVAVFEFPYVLDMIADGYFDTVYHEHLCYHALSPLSRLCEMVGLTPLRVDRVNFGASGPALRLAVGRADTARRAHSSVVEMIAEERQWGISDPANYLPFAERVRTIIAELRTVLEEAKRKGSRIGAYSAPAKGNTLLNSAKIEASLVEAVSENNTRKIGLVTPGTHIPIISDEEFLSRRYDLALLLSWNYADHFVRNSEFAKSGGKFLIPLPHPTIAP